MTENFVVESMGCLFNFVTFYYLIHNLRLDCTTIETIDFAFLQLTNITYLKMTLEMMVKSNPNSDR